MDKNVRELAGFMTAYCEKTRKSTTGCPGSDKAGCDACMAKGLSDAGYLKPSPSEFKVIGDEEIKSARLLTADEIMRCTKEAAKFALDNKDVPEAFELKSRELCGALSGYKIAQAQLTACNKVIQYYQSQELEQGIGTALLKFAEWYHKNYTLASNKLVLSVQLKNEADNLLLLINSQRMGEQQKVSGENEELIKDLKDSNHQQSEAIRYRVWQLKLIELIINTRLHANIKQEEIKVVLRDTDAYSESFKDGDTPEEAWQGELEALADSQ